MKKGIIHNAKGDFTIPSGLNNFSATSNLGFPAGVIIQTVPGSPSFQIIYTNNSTPGYGQETGPTWVDNTYNASEDGPTNTPWVGLAGYTFTWTHSGDNTAAAGSNTASVSNTASFVSHGSFSLSCDADADFGDAQATINGTLTVTKNPSDGTSWSAPIWLSCSSTAGAADIPPLGA